MPTPTIWPLPMRPATAPHRESLRLAVGQLRLPVGDLDGNTERIAETMAWAEGIGADVLVLPELAITGYPPEDLVHRPDFVGDNLAALEQLSGLAGRCVTVVGFVDPIEEQPSSDATVRNLANAVALLHDGHVRGRYHKVLLPNYGVFDERRYFAAGDRVGGTWSVHGAEIGVVVCEDLWRSDTADAQAGDGAQALVSSNASPYHRGKQAEREENVISTARRCGMPVAYGAGVGGQDEVLFDGGSMIVDQTGTIVARAPRFEEARLAADVSLPSVAAPPRSTFVCRMNAPAELPPLPSDQVADAPDELEEAYRAIVTAMADLAGERIAVVGVSGGVDSALVAAIAADALGPERVRAVTLPGPYTPSDATADARELGARLGVPTEVLPVDDVYQSTLDTLGSLPDARPETLGSEESLVPSVRALLLRGLAARVGGIVLETANKTETALGYVGGGGLLAGEFAPLKDVPKTLVYELCHWRNRTHGSRFGWAGGTDVIPETIIKRPPSARRVPDRPDRELPADYVDVDAILERFVELSWSPDNIVGDGYDREVVQRVVELVDRNEHLRAELPPGVKVTARGFGRDRRMPIAHRYRSTVTPAGEERTDLGSPQVASEELWIEG